MSYVVSQGSEGQLAVTPGQGQQLEAQGYVKCRNPRCQFYNAPHVAEGYAGLADDVDAGQVNPDQLIHTCPHCGHQYNFVAQPGMRGQKRLAPGGTTHIGLPPSVQGQIGEDLVEKLGQGDFAGYGPFLWFHHGGSSNASALDAMLQNWGVEIKTIDWTAANRRFIVNNVDAQKKNQAAQDPNMFAKELGDPKLDDVLEQLDVQGVLGILVLLNFDTSTADVFVREFPYGQWGTNQFGDPIKGVRHFRETAAIHAFANVPFDNPLPDPTEKGFVPHNQRPEDFSTPFDEPVPATFAKTALDYAGDSHPGQEPQAVADQERSLGGNEWDLGPREYKFFYANGELEVSPKHSHDELRSHIGIDNGYSGPIGHGLVTVDGQRATWELDTNVGLSAMVKVLQDYTEQVGWTWGGLTNTDGEPVSDDFAPKRSVYYFYDEIDDHLTLSPEHSVFARFGQMEPKTIELQGKRILTQGMGGRALEALGEWAQDEGFEVVAGSSIKRMEDLEQWNFSDPDAPIDTGHDRDRLPTGVFRCPNCRVLFPNWHVYMEHRRSEEPMGDEAPYEDGGFPDTEENAIQDAHTTPRQPDVFPIAFVHAAQDQPKDWLDNPAPFVYDIDGDAIYVGSPGQRSSEIAGDFSPGGIVEGTYEPGGKVYIRTQTNMPFTLRHMLDLWYYQHPEFEVKDVFTRDLDGKERKLAVADYGQQIRTLAHADPAVVKAAEALRGAGGNLYVVGGAVRDLLLNKTPKDIDLLVQGVPAEGVRRALEALPGRVDLTGKDFGVFRYRHAGHEVEVALPRRERSTGASHTDFDVQADHTMSVEEDLARRDFTANAIAVDFDDGELIDPFDGAEDIKNGVLRTVSPKSFEEDPLRVIRALVAYARHGLVPDENTKQQMRENALGITHLAPERIQAELDKVMASPDPAAAIHLAHDEGVLGYFLPEVEQAWNFDQNNPHHALPLGEHLLEVLRNIQKQTDDPDLRLAALLHDIGKPESAWLDPDSKHNHFHRGPDGQGMDHDAHGANLAEQRLQELRYPRNRVDRIRGLVAHHMFSDFSSDKGARKFLNKVGDHADDLLTLRDADREGKGTPEYQDTKTPVDRQRELVDNARNAQAPTEVSMLAINGNDLMSAGMQPGPEMGQTLQRLVQVVLEHPEYNTKDKLLELVHGL